MITVFLFLSPLSWTEGKPPRDAARAGQRVASSSPRRRILPRLIHIAGHCPRERETQVPMSRATARLSSPPLLLSLFPSLSLSISFLSPSCLFSPLSLFFPLLLSSLPSSSPFHSSLLILPLSLSCSCSSFLIVMLLLPTGNSPMPDALTFPAVHLVWCCRLGQALPRGAACRASFRDQGTPGCTPRLEV